MKKTYCLLFAVLAHGAQAVREICMETVNVGQGAASFLTLEDPKHGKIVVIFDAGSSSNFVHQKFVPDRWEQSKYSRLFEPKKDEPAAITPDSSAAHSDTESSTGSIDAKTATAQPGLQEKIDAQKDKSITRLKELGIYPSHNLEVQQIAHMAKIVHDAAQCWFIISHSDKDHMNYVSSILEKLKADKRKMVSDAEKKLKQATSKETTATLAEYQKAKTDADKILPKKVFAILGGDWFTNRDFTKPGHSTDEKNTLKALVKTNAKIVMPYYLEDATTHAKIVDNITGAYSSTIDDTAKLVAAHQLANSPLATTPLSGSLGELATTFGLAVDEIPDVLCHSLRFWGLNNGADPNSQSIVASYTDVDNNMSFVFTGDSEETSFRALRGQIKGKIGETDCNRDDVLRTTILPHLSAIEGKPMPDASNHLAENHLVFFQVPHHGARDNIAQSAYATFMPDAFIFSAGDGELYDHPHRDTYDFITTSGEIPTGETISPMTPWFKRAKAWRKRLELRTAAYLPLFKQQRFLPQSTQKVKFKRIDKNTPFIFLSTQTTGNIAITSKKLDAQPMPDTIIAGQNDFVLEYDKTLYKEQFRSAVGILSQTDEAKDEIEIKDISFSIEQIAYMRDFIKKFVQKLKKIDQDSSATLYNCELVPNTEGLTSGDILLIAKKYPQQLTTNGEQSTRTTSPSTLVYPNLSAKAGSIYKEFKRKIKTDYLAKKTSRSE